MLTVVGQIGALFTAPALAAAGAAAVSIPVAIHLLSRLRRARVTWAAMRFLEEAWKRQRRRMQLEQLLLLFVRCLLMVILGLALAGPQSALLGALGLNQSSRLICIVLDDSLASQALEPGGEQRFEALKQKAIAVIDAARPGDQIALWTMASPVAMPITLGPVDRDGGRKIIETLTPGYAKADLPGAMMEVGKVLTQSDLPRERIAVVVISDFAQGTLSTQEAPPQEMAQMASRAMIWLDRPNLSLPNVQISKLTSLRGLVLAQPLTPLAIPLTVQLSRFGIDAAEQLSVVHVQLSSADGKQKREITKSLRWAAGQSQAVLNIEAPAADMLPGGGVMKIQARVESISGEDALEADDWRWTTLDIRQQLHVGLVDKQAAAGTAEARELSPGTWLELALAPAAGQTMDISTLEPSTLTIEKLSLLDAVLVLRPDLLSELSWTALATAASQGRLVWVMTPPGLNDGGANDGAAQLWPQRMTKAFDLPWLVGGQRVDFTDPLALKSDGSVPEPLAMLGPDWQAMLRPVRISRLVNLSLQTALPEEAWITTADNKVVMASRPVGQGQLIVQTVAIDPQWTDLMVKPLFVPLVHETLRGVLGEIAARLQNREALPGQKLQLPVHWQKVDHLELMETPWQIVNANKAAVEIETVMAEEQQQRITAEPLKVPGVYQPVASDAATTAGYLQAVNLDPQAGDLQALSTGQLLAWFEVDVVAQPEPWIDQANPGSMLSDAVAHADLGLPLLWTLLALVLFETFLARRFSHSQTTSQGPSWLGQWWKRMVS